VEYDFVFNSSSIADIFQTVISSSPIWYLHDKTAFPSPKLFRPSRWLEDSPKSEQEIKLRDEFYIPFSKGSAACVGAQ